MDAWQIVAVVGLCAAVAVVWILRGRISGGSIEHGETKASFNANQRPPGVDIEGVVTRKGNVTAEDHTGAGVKGKDVDAADSATFTAHPPPKQ